MDVDTVTINLYKVKGVVVINEDIFELPIVNGDDFHKKIRGRPLPVHVLIHDGEYVGTADYWYLHQFEGTHVIDEVKMMDVYTLVDYDDLSDDAKRVIGGVCETYKRAIVAISANGTHIRCFDYREITDHYIKQLHQHTEGNRQWKLPDNVHGLTTADNILLLYYIGRKMQSPPEFLNVLCGASMHDITRRENKQRAERGAAVICAIWFIASIIWQCLTKVTAQIQVMTFLGIVFLNCRMGGGPDPWVIRYWRRVRHVENMLSIRGLERELLQDKHAHIIMEYVFPSDKVPLD
jgi:hypothetical protein